MIETKACDPAKTRVTVLDGGSGGEREISFASAAACIEALKEQGFPVVEIDTESPNFIQDLIDSKPDVVFIAIHGRDGEDGTVQGLCELLHFPYTGPGVLASALALDKIRTKNMYKSVNLPTPAWAEFLKGDEYDAQELFNAMNGKCIVKPSREGSTIGIRVVHNVEELDAAMEEAFKHDKEVLVEEFIEGTEVTVGVLGNDVPMPLPVIEIEVPERTDHYDYESKYKSGDEGGAKHILPARISEELTMQCKMFALIAYGALGCQGMARTDMIISEKDNTPYLIETNTIPGMTPTSLLPDAAAAEGISFPELCKILVELALERG